MGAPARGLFVWLWGEADFASTIDLTATAAIGWLCGPAATTYRALDRHPRVNGGREQEFANGGFLTGTQISPKWIPAARSGS
jgi:hypothetical protein